jgi:hypothetical protein
VPVRERPRQRNFMGTILEFISSCLGRKGFGGWKHVTCRFECERSMFVVLAAGSKPTSREGTGRLEVAIFFFGL